MPIAFEMRIVRPYPPMPQLLIDVITTSASLRAE